MANDGFKRCVNGHFYPESNASCPYCKGGAGANDETETRITDDGKTEFIGGDFTIPMPPVSPPMPPTQGMGHDANATFNMKGMESPNNHTVFGDNVEVETANGNVKVDFVTRQQRKLVGWLVSYSFDPLGVSFCLYEGRNLIGRDNDNNIPIPVDGLVSGKHAILLYRDGVYLLSDDNSTHGTRVNDKDIWEEKVRLNDGDDIKIGNTVLKFRTSL